MAGGSKDSLKVTSLIVVSLKNNRDGTFTDVTKGSGLELRTGWGQACCVGDYDNDGHDDLFVTYYGQNVLYHNNGGRNLPRRH